jgi:predicted acyltransferase
MPIPSLATAPAPGTAAPPAPQRLVSLDAYRGLVMFLMMAEVLRLAEVAARVPASRVWNFLAFHQTHAPWAGCSLHDLIQPSFSFLVGVALPFSIASRTVRGQSRRAMTAHAFWRAFLLVALGIFLRSIGRDHTYFTFEDTLTQIGLGYGVLFLLGFRTTRDAWIAFGLIQAGYWAAFALYPLPGPGFDWTAPASPPTGGTTTKGSRLIGTRTRTSPGRSTAGSSTCSRRRAGSRSTGAATRRSASFRRWPR